MWTLFHSMSPRLRLKFRLFSSVSHVKPWEWSISDLGSSKEEIKYFVVIMPCYLVVSKYFSQCRGKWGAWYRLQASHGRMTNQVTFDWFSWPSNQWPVGKLKKKKQSRKNIARDLSQNSKTFPVSNWDRPALSPNSSVASIGAPWTQQANMA